MSKQIVQKLGRRYPDVMNIAEAYYRVISAFNHLKLTNREIQLLAHSSIHGNVNSVKCKESFCNNHDTSIQTVNNMISKLKRKGLFVKDGRKMFLHPAINIDFNKNVNLIIRFEREADKKDINK